MEEGLGQLCLWGGGSNQGFPFPHWAAYYFYPAPCPSPAVPGWSEEAGLPGLWWW